MRWDSDTPIEDVARLTNQGIAFARCTLSDRTWRVCFWLLPDGGFETDVKRTVHRPQGSSPVMAQQVWPVLGRRLPAAYGAVFGSIFSGGDSGPGSLYIAFVRSDAPRAQAYLKELSKAESALDTRSASGFGPTIGCARPTGGYVNYIVADTLHQGVGP